MIYSKEEIQRAKDTNLVELLLELNYPLKKITANEYCLLAHDSCRISPTRGFYWHSQSKGGNAIDFFMILENMSFIKSVQLILSHSNCNFTTQCREVVSFQDQEHEKELKLPMAHWNNQRAISYLSDIRKIDMDIILYCIREKLIYEATQTHNVVFVGYDGTTPKFACQRGTCAKRFVGDVFGSDKSYGFSLGNVESSMLHIFESPIDLLSFLTINKLNNLRSDDFYISLSGVSLLSFKNVLECYNPHIVYVQTDNDEKGRLVYQRLKKYVDENAIDYVTIVPAHPELKDVNEDLIALVKEKVSEVKT